MSDPETPWPCVGDVLFVGCDDWWHNACVGWSNDQWIGYVEGYKLAAELLSQHVSQTKSNQDFLIYPIVFLFRQAIEVSLKYVLLSGNRLVGRKSVVPHHHRLVPLWQQCRSVIEEIWKSDQKEDLDAVGEVLAQFDSWDPNSTVFRNPVDTSGRAVLTTHELINIRNLSEVAGHVLSFLDGCGTGINEYIQQKGEMERDYSW